MRMKREGELRMVRKQETRVSFSVTFCLSSYGQVGELLLSLEFSLFILCIKSNQTVIIIAFSLFSFVLDSSF